MKLLFEPRFIIIHYKEQLSSCTGSRGQQSRAGSTISVAGRASLNSSFTFNYDHKLLWKDAPASLLLLNLILRQASCLTPDRECCDVAVRCVEQGSEQADKRREITLMRPVIGLYNGKQHGVTAVVIWRYKQN